MTSTGANFPLSALSSCSSFVLRRGGRENRPRVELDRRAKADSSLLVEVTSKEARAGSGVSTNACQRLAQPLRRWAEGSNVANQKLVCIATCTVNSSMAKPA